MSRVFPIIEEPLVVVLRRTIDHDGKCVDSTNDGSTEDVWDCVCTFVPLRPSGVKFIDHRGEMTLNQ